MNSSLAEPVLPEVPRLKLIALLLPILIAGCAPSIRADLKTIQAGMGKKTHEELADRSLVELPGTTESRLARQRIENLGPEALPILLRIAGDEPNLTHLALNLIASYLMKSHPHPWKIPRTAPGGRDYWVVKEPTGEGLAVIMVQDVKAHRVGVLDAFRRFLQANGYLED